MDQNGNNNYIGINFQHQKNIDREVNEMNQKYSKLFKSFTFRSGITIKNRVVMAPMKPGQVMTTLPFQMKR
jgi:hypothetical protein